MFHAKPDGVAPLAGILIESFHLIRKNIVPVIAPFPDIAQHIIKSPFVGFFQSNWTGFYEFAIPCTIIQRTVKSGLTGVFPLSFGGQGKLISFRKKGTEFLIHLPGEGKSLLPSHIDRRQMDFPLVFVGLVSHHILPLLTGNLTVAQIKVLCKYHLMFRFFCPAKFVEFFFIPHNKSSGRDQIESYINFMTKRKCQSLFHNHTFRFLLQR